MEVSKARAGARGLVVLHKLRGVRKAIGFQLLSDICLYSGNDFMCSIAILLWICGVSALASAHDNSLFSVSGWNLRGLTRELRSSLPRTRLLTSLDLLLLQY